MTALERETAVYQSRRVEFEKDHNMKWAVDRGERLWDSFLTFRRQRGSPSIGGAEGCA